MATALKLAHALMAVCAFGAVLFFSIIDQTDRLPSYHPQLTFLAILSFGSLVAAISIYLAAVISRLFTRRANDPQRAEKIARRRRAMRWPYYIGLACFVAAAVLVGTLLALWHARLLLGGYTAQYIDPIMFFVYWERLSRPVPVLVIIALCLCAFAFAYNLIARPDPLTLRRSLYRWLSKYRKVHRGLVEKRIEDARRREVEKHEAPKKDAVDSEAAIEDMRLGRSYIDDWINAKGGIKEANKSHLSFAAQYVEVARTKDPNAQLVIDTAKEGTQTFTQDDLAAEILFYESQYFTGEHATPQDLRQAESILKKALTFKPSSVQYREHLADVYLNLHDKQNARHVAYQALREAPYDLRARKLLDRIEAAPATQPPPAANEFMRGGFLAFIGGCAIFIGIGVLFAGLFQGYATTGIFVIVVGFILIFIGNQMETSYIFRKAYENEIRKRGPR